MLTQCGHCQNTFERQPRAIKASVEKHGIYVCRKCFWNTPQAKEQLRLAMNTSEAFKASRAVVSQKLSGSGNPMFDKKHRPETLAKMSVSRTGKFGENATAWKGGNRSLNATVKSGIYRRYGWHKKIYERDGCVCTECGSTKQLDAHHTTPFAELLKSLSSPLVGDELIEWLISHPTLNQAEGITLCRKCHKAAHQNWGSHRPKVSK